MGEANQEAEDIKMVLQKQLLNLVNTLSQPVLTTQTKNKQGGEGI